MSARPTPQRPRSNGLVRHLAILVITLGLVTFTGALQADSLNRDELQDLLRQGNELFQQANELAAQDPVQAREVYSRALMRFERILREGEIANGRLYYNIGNIHFRMNDVGRAILNYRRAQQFIPNDPNLHQNLEYARARRLDRVELQQQTVVLRTLFFWHYDLSTKTRSILFAGSFALFWVFAGLRLFHRRPHQVWLLGACGLLALLMLSSILVEDTSQRRSRPGVVLSREVVARKGDSETYAPSFQEPLHAGTEFILVEERGNWRHIELLDGQRCWIPVADCELVR